MHKEVIIKKCPFCGCSKIRPYCIDWQGNDYRLCVECDLIFQGVYNKYDYSERYWTEVVDPDGKVRDMRRERDFKLKNWYGEIISYINRLDAGRILDIGCGLGFLLSAIDEKWEKVGFDATDKSFDFIREQSSNIALLCGDLDYVIKKYSRNLFDVVVCYHVLEHVEKPVQFFNKIVRLLSKNGTLIVGTPNSKSLCSKWFKGNYRLLGNGHLSLFSPEHIRSLFKDNNLCIVKSERPFFKTSYFTFSNIFRLVNNRRVSPPFYGNIMTFYGAKQS